MPVRTQTPEGQIAMKFTDFAHSPDSAFHGSSALWALVTQRWARRAGRRSGAVLVETALVIILLLGLCFGVMEYGHYVYTRHTLESACQRGARVGLLRDSTSQEISDEIESEMAAAGFDATEFDVVITGKEDPDETNITVAIECVWGEIGVRPLGLISGDSLVRASVTMRKEDGP